MDDLNIALNNSGIRGYLGDAFLNHTLMMIYVLLACPPVEYNNC